MTCLKIANVDSALRKKGFQKRVIQKKHKGFEFFYNGHRTGIFTFYSHSADEINDFLIAQMAGQLFLSKEEFIGLVCCSVSEDRYIEILIRKGELQQ